MKATTEQVKAWAQIWQTAGVAMESVKRQELQALDGTNYLETIDGMLQWTCNHAVERSTSGLIEQQRIFARLLATT